MRQMIVTTTGQALITNALSSTEKVKPKYFKITDDTTFTLDPNLTDIPNPVLTKDLNGWFKVSDTDFRLMASILQSEYSGQVVGIGIFDVNDNLIFVGKYDPALEINQDKYLSFPFRLSNFEEAFDFTEVPWDEYQQTIIILDILTKLQQLQNELADLKTFINIEDYVTHEELNEAITFHNEDTLAHPYLRAKIDQIIEAIKKAGIYVDLTQFKYVGQFWDEFAVFADDVQEDDFVYKGADGRYYRAIISDDELTSKVVGIAKPSLGRVITSGFVETGKDFTGIEVGSFLFLSDTDPGQFTTNQTDILVGIYLGDSNILLTSFGSGIGGKGEVTFEDLSYSILTSISPFNKVYYDTFERRDITVTTTQGTTTFNKQESQFEATEDNTYIETVEYTFPETQYRISVHYEGQIQQVFYMVNDSGTWVETQKDELILVEDGINSVKVRFVLNTGDYLDSYGILYEYRVGLPWGSAIKLYELLVVDQDYPANTEIQIPNGQIYTNDNRSLEIYLNRVRLVNGIDYVEVDNRTVRFLIPLRQNDLIIFQEYFGEVDVSIENKRRLDLEHDEEGHHVLTDEVTGIRYRLVLRNRELLLEEIE